VIPGSNQRSDLTFMASKARSVYTNGRGMMVTEKFSCCIFNSTFKVLKNPTITRIVVFNSGSQFIPCRACLLATYAENDEVPNHPEC